MPYNPALRARARCGPGVRALVGGAAAAVALAGATAAEAHPQAGEQPDGQPLGPASPAPPTAGSHPRPAAAPVAPPSPGTDPRPPTASVASPSPGSSAAQYVPYQVREGDSLSSIAAAHGLPAADGWRQVFDANPQVADPDVIHPGQVLVVPPAGAALADRQLPAAAVATAGSPAQQAPSDSTATASQGVWDRLARCESGGDWSIDSTYDGGLQFDPDTWRGYGGTRYAPQAHQATRSQQIAVAQQVLFAQGWSAWPACSRRLGLR